jgi:DNA-binding Lrp family transcriptional regulator
MLHNWNFVMKRMMLTPRDLEILDTLTLRVRYLSLAQIARTWWADAKDPPANTRERLKKLEAAGFLLRFTAMARPEFALIAPVIVWQPNDPMPDFGAASYQLQSRWMHSAVATPAVIATATAGHRFGGHGGRFPRQSEQSHDLMMGTLYLHYRQLLGHAVITTQWISEERLRAQKQAGEKLPDAMLRSAQREFVIECGGAYSKEKLSHFHEYCAEQSLPYEIW